MFDKKKIIYGVDLGEKARKEGTWEEDNRL